MIDTILCSKCKDVDIDLEQDNLRIFNAKAGTLTAICPECRGSTILNKEISAPLIEMYFAEEVQAKLDNQESGEKELFDSPSCEMADDVDKTFDILGLSGKEWKKKRATIKGFVSDVPVYQTQEGLTQLLTTFKVDPRYIQLIIQKVFGSVPKPPLINCTQPGIMPFGMPAQNTPTQTPTSTHGYQVLPTSQGQVIIVPPTPQQAAPSSDEGDHSMYTIEEVLDDKGKVVKRITRPIDKNLSPPVKNPMLDTLIVLKELGIVGSQSTPSTSPEMVALVESVKGLKDTYASALRGGGSDSSDAIAKIVDKYEERFDQIQAALKESDEKRQQSEISHLNTRINELTHERDDKIPSGMSEAQQEMQQRTKAMDTLANTVENMVSKIIDPINEINKSQMAMNRMMMVREMEVTDGATPGTYVKSVQTQPEPSDTEVEASKAKWAKRAGSKNKKML